jgi:hypothetical protein
LPAKEEVSQCLTEDAIPSFEAIQLLRSDPQVSQEACDTDTGAASFVAPAVRLLIVSVTLPACCVIPLNQPRSRCKNPTRITAWGPNLLPAFFIGQRLTAEDAACEFAVLLPARSAQSSRPTQRQPRARYHCQRRDSPG